MKYFHTCMTWGLAFVAIVLSPIILIFAIPLAVGIGLDIFDLFGNGPIALALSAPVAFAVLHRVSPRAVMRQFAGFVTHSRQPLHPSAELTRQLDYAPKSIS